MYLAAYVIITRDPMWETLVPKKKAENIQNPQAILLHGSTVKSHTGTLKEPLKARDADHDSKKGIYWTWRCEWCRAWAWGHRLVLQSYRKTWNRVTLTAASDLLEEGFFFLDEDSLYWRSAHPSNQTVWHHFYLISFYCLIRYYQNRIYLHWLRQSPVARLTWWVLSRIVIGHPSVDTPTDQADHWQPVLSMLTHKVCQVPSKRMGK